MARTTRMVTFALAAVSLVLLGTGRVTAQIVVVSPPAVSYYSPPVVYAAAPAVSYSYAPAPAVSYYYAPSVSYYAPAVSYYAPAVSYYPAPAAVMTTRYGLFGRPRVTTTYYPPVYYRR
ncbi:MAG TPA: hypothetical protein VKA46_42740 [Gemmataceae bacterium]|nr:hypothetical protein [Gemmataceae bacterium]